MAVKADELVHVRGQGTETFPEFDSFPLFLTFGARFRASLFPAFEERPGGEALERDPRHEVHLAEGVSLEYVQRPADPDRMAVIFSLNSFHSKQTKRQDIKLIVITKRQVLLK